MHTLADSPPPGRLRPGGAWGNDSANHGANHGTDNQASYRAHGPHISPNGSHGPYNTASHRTHGANLRSYGSDGSTHYGA